VRLLVLVLLSAFCSSGAAAQNRGTPRVAPEVLFERYDKNGDGRLTRDEIPRVQLFPRVDRDGDRSVSLAELKAFMEGAKPAPGKAGPRSGAFGKAADYLEGKNGHALLVYHRDKLIFEEYFNGWSADKPHRLASGTKSFSGIMAITAVEDGLLKLDEPIADTITEWRDDPRKGKVTIRQLLTLSSGIHGGKIGTVPGYVDALAQAEARFRPGAKFQYGPIPFQVFGEVMRRKLEPSERSVEQYLRDRILDPIGMRADYWRRDGAGNVRLPSGVLVTAREWAKFGLFVLHHGEWKGRQVLPADAVRGCFVGTRANPNYGLTFWLGDKGSGVEDLVMAAGAGKQKLFIIPSRELLVVQFAEATRTYKEARLLDLVLADLPGE